ncbi:MAG: DNA polymerase Y family protein, partial [Betaproteobacteria bacterium]|nr:DNA polymerase Y family protein [Betaproteobacteria bacterium]
GLQDMGYTAAIACASTATAAWLLARNGGSRVAIERSALEPVIAALPVAVLDCDAATRTTFAAIGAKRIGDLLRLPRDGLARRCGPRLLDILDRALGKLPEARRSFTPPEHFEVKLELAAEVTHSEALLFAAKRQLTQLAGFLAARRAGIQRFTLALLHEVQPPTVTEIGLVAPTRDVRHLIALTRERLAVLTLSAPVRALQLTAGDICALAAENYSLFRDGFNAQGEWQQFVERLRARLGQDAVYGIAARPDHRPEHAWYATQPGTRNVAIETRPRPLWLLDQPQPLRTIASKPHYRNDALALIAGPERIESGWWDGTDAKRDYFIAQTPACATLWIYRERREPCGWYLHGVFG